MKKQFPIIAFMFLALACQKHSMRGKYDYLVGTWKANSNQWCTEDSSENLVFELEFTNNADVIFRKNGEEKRFDIVSRHYDTYSDYKIWYYFVLDNNEKLNVETDAVAGFEFNTILITTHRDFFECVNDTANYRPLRRAQ